MPPAVAGGGRRLFSAARAGQCSGAAAALLAAIVKRALRPANRRTGGRTPARKGDTRPDGDRQRSVALGAPAIRGKPLSALGQGGAAATTHPARKPQAGADSRRADCRLRHRTFRHHVCATSTRRAHPRHRSELGKSELRQAHGQQARIYTISNSPKPTSPRRPRSAAGSISSTCPACCTISPIRGRAGVRYCRCCDRAA